MIVIMDEATGYKIVSIEKLGWFFYDPHTKQSSKDVFVHYDDLMKRYVEDWARSTDKVLLDKKSTKEAFFSYEFGRYLLQRFVKTLSSWEKPLLSNGQILHSQLPQPVNPLSKLELVK